MWFRRFITCLVFLPHFLLLSSCISNETPRLPASEEVRREDEIYFAAKRVMDQRCVACHSCYTSPCQLDLTSYEGMRRGATKALYYNPQRLSAVTPTRLYIDAKSENAWREKGFFSVLPRTPKDTEKSIFEVMIDRSEKAPAQDFVTQLGNVFSAGPQKVSEVRAEESNICPATTSEARQVYFQRITDGHMPFGLPALSAGEHQALKRWLKAGAPGPASKASIDAETLALKDQFESFLNRPGNAHALTSRYIYEHLFLAHLYFQTPDLKNHSAQKIPPYFRLYRTKGACPASVLGPHEEIATLRPYGNPGVARPSYCFRLVESTITDKNHLPYNLSAARMKRWEELFLEPMPKVDKLPSYETAYASNPFTTFKDLSPQGRYQFLLDDAQFIIATFIKGPVCRGGTAVNSIDEQFHVFFLKPESDDYIRLPRAEYAAKVDKYLRLPAELGSDPSALQALTIPGLIKDRNRYRTLRQLRYEKSFPRGYSLEDIWNGETTFQGQKSFNDNAALTVFRHFDSAQVEKGALGPVSKTAFVLDYPLLERLVYDLVTGFDVFGNIEHQVETRLYMGLIRMEAEELYLSFLPPKFGGIADYRATLRDSWYRGGPTQIKMAFYYPLLGQKFPTQVKYDESVRIGEKMERPKHQFLNQVLARMPEQAGLWKDTIHRRDLKESAPAEQIRNLEELEAEFAKLTSRRAGEAPFINYLSDSALLRVIVDEKNPFSLKNPVYTLIRNREHFNIAWINGEDMRLDPENDRMLIIPGIRTSYPNLFFAVKLSEMSRFIRELQAMPTSAEGSEFSPQVAKLAERYAILRTNPNFWKEADWFNDKARHLNPIGHGLLDLIRYENYQPK